jgi:phosphohistidine phosphatase
MKTLLLMRHAKSSWKDSRLNDHYRPLNKRGQKAAPRMGQLLKDCGLVPDRMLTSSAVRAQSTAQLVAQHAGFSEEIETRSELYHANTETFLFTLQELHDADSLVLLVGHNPGLEEFLELLTGKYERLPTAAVAQVELAITHWQDLEATTTGRLVQTWRPKELA